jgi:hypothetical protein
MRSFWFAMKRRRVSGGGVSGGGNVIVGDGDDSDVRVRSAEGEVVAWSRSAAARLATLANWVSDMGGAEGAFATLVPAAALRTLARVAESGGAEDTKALEDSSLAQLAQLLHGAHFLDVDVELRHLLSRTLCSGHLAGKSGPELGRLLGVASDFPTEAERHDSTDEPLYTQDAPAPRAAITPKQPPPAQPACTLSAQLDNEDALEVALAEADVPTLCALKGVSLAWRSRARRVLCARLCARLGLPLTCGFGEVTELNLSGSLAAGRLFADAADATRWLPNLATVTGLGGSTEVDVTALRLIDDWDDDFYPLADVRACIHGGPIDETPMEVLLATLALHYGEPRVPPNAFRGDTSLTSIALPIGLTKISEHAFSGCSSLTSIALPATLTSLGAYAFSGCSSLTSIALPATLTSLGAYAFNGCSSMTSIALPAGLTSLGESAFDGCSSMASVALPPGLTSLAEHAFASCHAITSIALPAGLMSIGEHAFSDCSSMTSIELPAGLMSLDWGAFDGCSAMTSIELPAGLTSLGESTFDGCSSMTSIELPADLTSLGAYAFFGCSSLTSIALPAGLVSLGAYTFYGCSALTSIALPAGLVSLGVQTFYNCSSLTTVALPTGLTSLGVFAFKNCSSLASIALPAGLTSLGRGAFEGCASMTAIALPVAALENLGEGAFKGCSSLTSIELTTSSDHLRLSSLDNLRSAGLPPSTILRFAPHAGL